MSECGLDSLSTLRAYFIATFGIPILIPAPQGWLAAMHRPPSSALFPAPLPDFGVLHDTLLDKTAPTAILPHCHAWVDLLALSGESIATPPRVEFPGPMACTLTRNTLPKLFRADGEEFLAAEKSDGMRALMYAVHESGFPQWGFEHAGTGRLQYLGLLDVLALEVGRLKLDACDDPAALTHVAISSDLRRCFHAPTADSVQTGMYFLGRDGRLVLREVKGVVSRNVMDIPLFRDVTSGRFFNYFIDRKTEAMYLVTEELRFEKQTVRSLLLDGEIMHNLKENRLNYSVFDIAGVRSPEDLLRPYGRDGVTTLHDRIAVIKNVVAGHYAACATMRQVTAPMSFQVMAKKYFSMAELPTLASFLVRGEGGRYTYKEYNYNDGIIFTPVSPRLFQFLPQSSEFQLKWKWYECQTVDWHIRPGTKPDQQWLYYFVRKKIKKVVISADHVRHTLGLVPNPKKIPIPDGGVVVECGWDDAKAHWSMQRARPEKAEANSFFTILNIAEAIVERLDLAELLSYSVAHGGVVTPRTLATFVRYSDLPEVHFIIRAAQESDRVVVKLQAQVWLPSQKNPYPVNIMDVESCDGLGAPTNEHLHGLLLIALANDGGSYSFSDLTCQAFFQNSVGRWRILSITKRKNEAQAFNVLRHLEAAARVVFLNPDSCFTDGGAQGATTTALAPSLSVFAHYDERAADAEEETGERSLVRKINNFVKQVTILKAMRLVRADGPYVMDMCCGRGGDLQKWRHAKVGFVFMVDGAFRALSHAAGRYCTAAGLSVKTTKKDGFPAFFHVADCFRTDIEPILSAALRGGAMLDMVSCQFSMHYAFCSDDAVQQMLRNVSCKLTSGGVFIGTIVNDAELLSRRAAHGDDFGNSRYHVKFVSDTTYSFHLGGCVQGEAEYVVPWEKFLALAAPHGLRLVAAQSFGDVFNEAMADAESRRLWTSVFDKRMRNEDDVPTWASLPGDDVAASGLYRAFILKKD